MNLGRNNSGGFTISPFVILAGVGIIVGGFIIGMATPSVFPVQASSEAAQVDSLFRFMLVIGGAIFLLVQGMLVYSIIRFRRREGDDADGPTIHGNTTLELIWTVIPSIIVLFLVVYSYSVWVSIQEPKDDELVVEVVGQRYNWNFTYTDPLGRLDDLPTQTFSDPMLHTYVGRPMLLQMETRDVNHSFWVPTMRIKQDLIAGRTTTVRFTPTKEGRYRVVCTELCGGGHGAMYSYIQVYADEQAWLSTFVDRRVENILNPPADPILQGADKLASNVYPCSGCHILQDEEFGIDWAGVTGPTLENIGDTAGRRLAETGNANVAEYLVTSIRHPNDYLVPGFGAGVMPQFGPSPTQPDNWDPAGGAYYVGMSDESLLQVVAYLCTQTADGSNACGDDESARNDSIQAAVDLAREGFE